MIRKFQRTVFIWNRSIW